MVDVGERPLCKCHGKPMIVPSDWRCAEKRRESQRRHYEAHTEQRLEYQRRYNETHVVDLNIKRYFRRLSQNITFGEQVLAELEGQIKLLSRMISAKETAS